MLAAFSRTLERFDRLLLALMIVVGTNSKAKAEAEAALVASLAGLRVRAVEYLLPASMADYQRLSGSGFEPAEGGVRISGSDSRQVEIRWHSEGFVDDVSVVESPRLSEADMSPFVIAERAEQRREFLGRRIEGAEVLWQRLADDLESLWGVVLSFGSRRVSICLGERDSSLGELTYTPNCLVVLFDEAIARQYTPATARSSAAGQVERR